MRIGIMTPGSTRNDAVSNDAAGMYMSLKQAGFQVFLLTFNGTSEMGFPAYSYADASWLLADPQDLLIYHYCTNDPVALSTMRQANCKLALKYHNVTPSRFFTAYSDLLTLSCRAGRRLLNEFLELPIEFVLCDSTFNADEITAAGYPASRCRVIPPYHHTDRLLMELEEPGTIAYVRESVTNVVTVGRVVPNKGYHLMIEALALLKRDGFPRIALQIVGFLDPRLEEYIAELQHRIDEEELQDWVHFHPATPGNALATFYRGCDLFWTASQHEGFCVPVVEAMAFGLPVLSSTQGALPETCADAAIFADTPQEMASALRRLVEDDAWRGNLAQKCRLRAGQFANRMIEMRFLEFMQEVVEGLPAVDLAIQDDWFGLPRPEEIDALARDVYDLARVATKGHRADAVFAVVTGAADRQAASDYFATPDVRRYAEQIATPRLGLRLSPAAKVFWRFSSFAQQNFPLTTPENLASFWRWYMRHANVGLLPLMSPSEQARFALGNSTY